MFLYLLGKIAEQAITTSVPSFLFAPAGIVRTEFPTFEVGELTHPALLRYLQERGINIALAKAQCKRAPFTHNGKPYFAIGFPNVAEDGSATVFQRRVAPKDISVILNSTANVSKAIDVLHGYGRIHCMLDNDEAGRKAYRNWKGSSPDASATSPTTTAAYKDLNDYLRGIRQNIC